MTLLVGYSGSRGFHNPFQADSFNTIIPTKASNGDYYWPVPWTGSLSPQAAEQALLYNPSVNAMMATDWMSRSWYDALTVKLSKKLSHGFQIEGSFTWSKTIDTTSGSATGDTFGLDYATEPFYNLSLDRGLSDFDVPRNLVINALYAVPTPKTLGSVWG